MIREYRPEPLTDFSKEENRRAFEEALILVKSELGKEYPLIINGERIFTEKKIISYNPANKDEVVGVVSKANQELAEKAIQEAAKKFEEWKKWPADARARLLFKAAAILRRRKHEFSAMMVYEAGKSWPEADADTAEAIDFMEFYGREMIRLGGSQPLTSLDGETNDLYWIPLGVGLVIPPWNFPLAILTGMTTAAVVSGNTVVLKPASATPVIAAKFMEVMEEAGMPDGVINYLPGSGGEVGDYLVEHPLTRFISFTGSKEVGLRINQKASVLSPGQKWIKRVVAEMGGKDAILVDKDADLEAAATGIVASAYGFQGQKCSACSRAIVHKDVYDKVLELVVEKTKAISMGSTDEHKNNFGPVIDKNAFESINRYIEIGKKEGRLVLGGSSDDSEGYFIEPTIIADVDPNAVIAQEEIFGPVLAMIKAEDLDDGIRIFNDTEYGLTGSLYAKSREAIEKCRQELHVGNLYFNRKSTGAIVGVHPFGGFNMSGTDSKAGGRDYLQLFMQLKSVSETL
ncbi:L-glutamate gamma-semialdehyde dehydrogenase [Vulcanibacillus modesticaldus]|uniref:L-glutamate gamma-semialdehyde dehydrogenase n=1 Tax=Vulcanibacillus modesticaldus TaxID=337097 RepID=A0A1D2YU49_9BACI|nr:L-glutamate gamma-semialdehyde dehydrogenase [Vulcanibacillus modesticaldus]OEF99240.1 L-glutamate gamma-semialdehyde dehydrogenase [Vulcanibacillus modesticaldus]